jgi:hypothetical protein
VLQLQPQLLTLPRCSCQRYSLVLQLQRQLLTLLRYSCQRYSLVLQPVPLALTRVPVLPGCQYTADCREGARGLLLVIANVVTWLSASLVLLLLLLLLVLLVLLLFVLSILLLSLLLLLLLTMRAHCMHVLPCRLSGMHLVRQTEPG